MLRLKATLVATTAVRPWRTGWSVERGVDFSVAVAGLFSIGSGPSRNDGVAAELPCFIGEDWAAPCGAPVARTFPSLTAGALSDQATQSASLRSWWSLAGKPSRT